MTGKIILVLLLTGLSQFGRSQELPDGQFELSFIAVITQNIDKSTEFYEKILGFEQVNRNNHMSRGFSQANLRRGNISLEIIQFNSAIKRATLDSIFSPNSRIQGIFKFGISVSNFDSWIEYMDRNEVPMSGRVVTDPNGRRMVIYLDPDNNRVQLFEK